MLAAVIPSVLIPASAIGYHDGYDAAVVAPSQIVLDGELDDAYLKSEKIVNAHQYKAGNSFYAYAAVTEQGLYVWASIKDPSIDVEKESAYGNAKDGDKMQVALQIASGDQFAWGYFDFDYGTLPINKNRDYATSKCLPRKATKLVSGGWNAEFYVPWDCTNKVDTSDFGKLSAYIGIQVNNYTTASGGNEGQAYDNPVAVPSVPMVQEMGGDVTLAGQLVVWSTLVSAITIFICTFLLRLGGAF